MRYETTRSEAIRRKRRRKRRIAAFFMTLILFLLIGIVVAGIIYYIKGHQKNKLSGSWEYRINYSDYIKCSVDDWLDEKSEEVAGFTPVSVILTINDDGTYSVNVDESSYRACEKEANAYLESRFNELVSDELLLAGYMGTDNVGSVSDSLVKDTLGGNLADYLKTYDITFLPSYEELATIHTEGSYSYDRKNSIIEFTDSEGIVSREKISLTENVMVLTGDGDKKISVNTGSAAANGSGSGNDGKAVLYPITFSRR